MNPNAVRIHNVHSRPVKVAGFKLKPGRSVFLPRHAWVNWLRDVPGAYEVAKAHLVHHGEDEAPPEETPSPKYTGQRTQEDRAAEKEIIGDEAAKTNVQTGGTQRKAKAARAAAAQGRAK